MEPPTRWFSSSKLSASVLLAGVVYSVLASFTKPFTIGADVVTALPIGLAAVVFGVRVGWPRSSRGIPAANPTEPKVPINRWSLVWLGMAGLVVGWELFVYSQAPRHVHPTLSSLIDTVDASHVGKTVMFGLWLLLGSYLILQ
jgi:hypothetical protein